jgi:hypothetical protein
MSSSEKRHPLIPDDDDGELDFAALGRAAAEANKTGAKTFPMPKGFTPYKHDPSAVVGTLAQLTNELHIACFKSDLPKVQSIIANGGAAGNRYRVNAKDVDSPPLALAVRRPANSEQEDATIAGIAKALIDAGAEVNPEDGESPLILACIAGGGKAGKAQTARVLIEAGADLRTRDGTQKMTALHWAVTCCFKNVVEVLLQHGASATSITGKPPHKAAPLMCREALVKLAQGNLIARPPHDEAEKEAIRVELNEMLSMLDASSAKRDAEKGAKKAAKKGATAQKPVSVS